MAAPIETVYLEEYDEHVRKADAEKEAIRKYVSTFGFDVKTNKTDLVLIVEGERLYVSSVVMELSSTVFAELIENLERNENGMFEIEIQDINCKDFVDFLACFYPGKHHQLSDESVFRILSLANHYNVNLYSCECYILRAIQSPETTQEMVSKCMSVGYEQNIQSVKDASLERIIRAQITDLRVPVKPLPSNKAARADFYDTVFPYLVGDENKFVFLKALIQKTSGLDMSRFRNPRHESVKLHCHDENWDVTLKKSDNNTIELWGIYFVVLIKVGSDDDDMIYITIHLNKVDNSGMVSDSGDTGDTADHSDITEHTNATVVMYVLHNRKKTIDDVVIIKQFAGLADVSGATNASFHLNKEESAGFVLQGDFKMSVHVLMDDPKTK